MEEEKNLFKMSRENTGSVIRIIVILLVLGVAAFFITNAVAGKKARYAAFADAGVDPVSVKFYSTELDYEWGHFIYEVDFIADGTEYEYWVKASDSTVIKKEVNYAANTTGQAAAVSETETTAESVTAPMAQSQNDDAQSQQMDNEQMSSDVSNDGEASDNGSTYIGVDKAKSIAVSHAGFSVSDVEFSKAKLEKDDGYVVYEIEFYKNNMEYEYKIDAATGTIKEYEVE